MRSHFAAGWSWLRRRPYSATALAVLLPLAVGGLLRRDSEWDQVYVRAAHHLWRGEDIYRPEDGYLYPPFMAWAALPFRALPGSASRAAWLLLNVACAMALVRWGWRAAGGPQLEAAAATPIAEHSAAILGVLCGIPYIENCFAHQQTDVVLGALLVGGCLLLTRSRALAAATCFGLAAAIKCTPLLFAPYLAWRGRFRAAVWLVVVALGVNLLPDLVCRSPSGRPWLLDYGGRYLLPLARPAHYVGTWGSDPMYNQSLAGAFHRWLLTTLTWTDGNCFASARATPPAPFVLRGAAYGTGLLLLAAAAWAAGRPGRRAENLERTSERGVQARSASDGGGLALAGASGLHGTGPLVGVSRSALECGAVLLLMLLLSPMSSKAHFGIVVLPAMCLARSAVRTHSRLLGALLAVAVALGCASLKDPLGERLYSVSLWAGLVTWQTVLLLIGCLVILRRAASGAALAAAENVRGRPPMAA
jgi:hypothetical protein